MFSSFLLMKSSTAANNYNAVSFGAKPDGRTDSTKAFLGAWQAACRSAAAVTVTIFGTIVAPSDYHGLGNSGYWILYMKVNRISINGGTLDARGASFWACRKSGKSCPVGARSMTFNWANDVVVTGLTSINSQATHLVINSCNNVIVRKVKLVAPDQSPNTDGLHVQGSAGVTVTDSTFQTGDDCISIGPGTRNLYMSKLNCGPGHGISIGSLGRDANEAGVENITLINCFLGSDNGVRIKTWARQSTGFVRNVLFQNLIMKNVQNPIIVDQNYCPANQGCPKQGSGVKISQVVYRNIQGTWRTQQALTFDCSRSNPCQAIRLHDIKLTFNGRSATSTCKNIKGVKAGVVMPQGCL
ncbi:Parallel beta-helix repeat [Arabidopsis suecica]|uniref:Parallel beta-helix repeat n=1 Tax=Arabidopsis suecica TaxID=45249 RepID=A0A8T2BD97_ARASU|nr:Parallel beta-helix repeat [Arabidopsis suecica]